MILSTLITKPSHAIWFMKQSLYYKNWYYFEDFTLRQLFQLLFCEIIIVICLSTLKSQLLSNCVYCSREPNVADKMIIPQRSISHNNNIIFHIYNFIYVHNLFSPIYLFYNHEMHFVFKFWNNNSYWYKHSSIVHNLSQLILIWRV